MHNVLRLSLLWCLANRTQKGKNRGGAANGYAQQISSLPVSTHEYQFTYWCPRHFYWCLRLPRDVAAIAKQQQYISSEIIMSTPTWVGWTNPEYDWTDRQLGSSAQIGLKITFLKPPTSESEKSLRTYKHLPRHSKYPLKNETKWLFTPKLSSLTQVWSVVQKQPSILIHLKQLFPLAHNEPTPPLLTMASVSWTRYGCFRSFGCLENGIWIWKMYTGGFSSVSSICF